MPRYRIEKADIDMDKRAVTWEPVVDSEAEGLTSFWGADELATFDDQFKALHTAWRLGIYNERLYRVTSVGD